MANSAMGKSKHFHVRSISMQSILHPLISKIEDELHRINVSDDLNGLGDLYSSIEDLLHLPSVRQALSHSGEKKWLEKDLEASVKLLDLCAAIKDMLVTVEEQVQELQSALRRVGVSACAYQLLHSQVCSKKETRNSIKKCKNQLERVERTCRPIDTASDLSVISRVLTEARDLTISLLRSVLLSLSMSGQKSKTSRWSFASKSVNLRKLASDGEQGTASVGAYNICIKDAEAGLACLFRRLVENRVSLLNILGLQNNILGYPCSEGSDLVNFVETKFCN